jgi:hypothetical protein
MMLLWDGLQVAIPAGMEPVTLDRGFIRLAGRDCGSVDLRFGAEKSPFSPERDGRRILRAAGLGSQRLLPFEETWVRSLPGPLYRASRLFVLRFSQLRGLVAMLFPAPPPPDLLQFLCRSLAWIPATQWRSWSCYDIAFETPPEYLLHQAAFRQGHFRLQFRKGGGLLVFERLAPADVLLDGQPLRSRFERFLPVGAKQGYAMIAGDDREIVISRRPGPFGRFLAMLGVHARPGHGLIRHVTEANRILILTEEGKPLSETDRQRLHASYAVTTAFKK